MPAALAAHWLTVASRGGSTTVPADDHVHTEWSWDARQGSMHRSCARAVALGLPSIAFTEHVDHTVWTAASAIPADHPFAALSDTEGRVTPPAFDAAGYLEAVDRCRSRFPGLRIRTGVELGEPHRHPDAVARVLAEGAFERVLGSLHSLADGDNFREPDGLYPRHDPAGVVRAYLREVAALATGSDVFAVLAHIDYPARTWPGVFDPAAFEDEFRCALRAIAATGRALEINTVVPLAPVILRWWREEGGQAVSFGSDAHEPERVALGFADAAALAEASGFRPPTDPLALWTRS
jgi:histidinol-phosphatase (PHP family)